MKTVDPIKKLKVKQSKYKGNSDAQALRDAGQSESTALHNVGPANKLLKTVKDEIIQELMAKDVNIEWLLKQYLETQALCKSKRDYATLKATVDSIAKYIAQIPDKSQQVIPQTPTKEDIDEMQNYINRLKAYE